MVLPGRIYFVLGPWQFGDFCKNFLPNIGEDQKKSYDFSSGSLAGTQARSQKFAMGGGLFWGSGGRARSRRRPMGVRGRSPQLPKTWGLGRSLQRSKFLHFFAK